MDWKQAIIEWRYLSAQERHQRHLRAIPRHETNSMAESSSRSVNNSFESVCSGDCSGWSHLYARLRKGEFHSRWLKQAAFLGVPASTSSFV